MVAAAAVAVAVILAAAICYWVVRNQLRGEVDTALRTQAAAFQHGDFRALAQPLPGIPASAGGPAQYVQFVAANGAAVGRKGGLALPVNAHTIAVANGNASAFLSDVNAGQNHLRMMTIPLTLAGNGQMATVAVQLARPLSPTDHVLSHLRLILLVLLAGGMALAAALGRLAARRVLAPLSEVTQTAEHIGETDDLSLRLVVHADDEVGQLARRFNEMLAHLQGSRAALDESVRAQRQLVADASHELRTPITSLRTNVEVLLADPGLDEEDRRRLLYDVVEQTGELTALIGDLIELARGDLPEGSAEDVRVDRIAEESVARAQRHSPGIHFETKFDPVIVEGVPDRLHRAINNLLDNAARHSPEGGTVEVTVDGSGVTVRDHGSGIDEQDLPHVFDRFFRGANTRGKQGSGLGLAIVRQVTEQIGGSVSAANAPDGGAVFKLQLPVTPAESAESAEPPAPAPAPAKA